MAAHRVRYVYRRFVEPAIGGVVIVWRNTAHAMERVWSPAASNATTVPAAAGVPAKSPHDIAGEAVQAAQDVLHNMTW